MGLQIVIEDTAAFSNYLYVQPLLRCDKGVAVTLVSEDIAFINTSANPLSIANQEQSKIDMTSSVYASLDPDSFIDFKTHIPLKDTLTNVAIVFKPRAISGTDTLTLFGERWGDSYNEALFLVSSSSTIALSAGGNTVIHGNTFPLNVDKWYFVCGNIDYSNNSAELFISNLSDDTFYTGKGTHSTVTVPTSRNSIILGAQWKKSPTMDVRYAQMGVGNITVDKFKSAAATAKRQLGL